MSSWNFHADLVARPRLAAALAAVHVAVALIPWLAGVEPAPAAVLAALSLCGLPATLRTVPGDRCGITAVAAGSDGLALRLADGRDLPVRLRSSSRVLPGCVLLQLDLESRRRLLWIPRGALEAQAFRRLKVAVRAGLGGTQGLN
jgi:hypothetical protein